jgi:hypothetical protein
MSNVINNTFWAVFFGSTLGTLTVYLITTIVDEYRHLKHHRDMNLLIDQWEDYEFED